MKTERLPDGYYCLTDDACLSAMMREAGMLCHDRYFLDQITTHITPGSTVIDGGAFIGDHAIEYAKYAGLVVAFEPHWPNYLGLCTNVFVGGHENILPLRVALGEADNKVECAEVPGNAGSAYVAVGAACPESFQALMFALDKYTHSFGRVSVVKLDVEGWEVRALLGAHELIAEHRPVLVVEVNSGTLQRQGTTDRKLVQTVESFGYVWHSAVGEPWSVLWDLIAVPK